MLLQKNEPQHNELTNQPLGALKNPAHSRSLAIAMVVAAVFLIIAAGVIAWLIITPRSPAATVANQATDDVRDVKNVSFLPPADLPANYVMNNQSKNDHVQVYYYDDVTNCGFTVGVGDVMTGKTVKDTVIEAVTAAQVQGISTTGKNDGDAYELHDADVVSKAYTFESVNLDQDVAVDGVAFTKQNNTILYKQFGSKIASLSYACKAETWTATKTELATLASKFTVKTER